MLHKNSKRPTLVGPVFGPLEPNQTLTLTALWYKYSYLVLHKHAPPKSGNPLRHIPLICGCKETRGRVGTDAFARHVKLWPDMCSFRKSFLSPQKKEKAGRQWSRLRIDWPSSPKSPIPNIVFERRGLSSAKQSKWAHGGNAHWCWASWGVARPRLCPRLAKPE